jgi:hypothetical protein
MCPCLLQWDESDAECSTHRCCNHQQMIFSTDIGLPQDGKTCHTQYIKPNRIMQCCYNTHTTLEDTPM